MKKLYFLMLTLALATAAGAQTKWAAQPVVAGTIYNTKIIGDTAYIMGQFSMVNGQTRNNLASFNVNTGALTAFSPNVSAAVQNLEKVGNHLVIVGNFFSVDGQQRYGAAMFNSNTFALESWKDTATYQSLIKGGIGVDGNFFYFAKYVNTSSTQTFIARVDADAGVTTAWRSGIIPNDYVNAILVKDSFVYVGGKFADVGGPDSMFDQLRRYYRSTGARDNSWHPRARGGSYGVIDIEPYNDHIFVGGDFQIIAGALRPGVAEVNYDGTITSFDPDNSSGQIFGIKVLGGYIWLAGNSYRMGGLDKWRVAEVNIATQTATCWDISDTSNAWSSAWDVQVKGDTVYTGSWQYYIFTGSPRPHPGINGITGPTTVAPNQTATYHLPYTAGNSYTWSITGGTGTSHVDSIVVTWGTGTTGIVKGIENNTNLTNCNSDTIYLTVNISATGITQQQPIITQVYPNPTANIVHVHTNCTGYQLFDVTGQLLLQQTGVFNYLPINLAPYHTGMYILNLTTPAGTQQIKLLKE